MGYVLAILTIAVFIASNVHHLDGDPVWETFAGILAVSWVLAVITYGITLVVRLYRWAARREEAAPETQTPPPPAQPPLTGSPILQRPAPVAAQVAAPVAPKQTGGLARFLLFGLALPFKVVGWILANGFGSSGGDEAAPVARRIGPAEWDGRTLKLGPNVEEWWEWDGATLRPAFGGSVEDWWTVEGRTIKPWSSGSVERWWQLDGDTIKQWSGGSSSTWWELHDGRWRPWGQGGEGIEHVEGMPLPVVGKLIGII